MRACSPGRRMGCMQYTPTAMGAAMLSESQIHRMNRIPQNIEAILSGAMAEMVYMIGLTMA